MEQRQTKQSHRQRRKTVISLCLVLLMMLVVLGGATVFIWYSLPSRNQDREASIAVFGVQSITVTGDTRYEAADIVEVSGIHEGQSIFSLNKVKAHEAILTSFPYLETVEIFNNSLNEVEIHVEETAVLGAMYHDGGWLVIGQNGKGLEKLEIESNTPKRYLYLKGAVPTEEAGVGYPSLDARSKTVVETLLKAFETYGFTGVSEVSLSDLSDIRLTMNNRITIKMGNATNLTYQIAVLKDSMPYIYESYGKKAEGVLDISSYSNDRKDMVVFTPEEALKTTTSSTTSSAAATGGTTAKTSASSTTERTAD